MILALEDWTKGVILHFYYLYYISNSLSNFICLSLLKDTSIYYMNKQQALYNKASQRALTFPQQWEQSFLLNLLNLCVLPINYFKTEDNFY